MRVNAVSVAALILTLSFLFAGCAIPGYVRDPSPWVETADWSAAQRVRVAVTETTLAPQVLTFTEGLPYVLELANTDREAHVFASEHFYRAVATRRASVPGAADLDAPRFTSLTVYPGKAVEFIFVAVRTGTYEVVCTHPGHPDGGLLGAIRILPAPGPSR